jgi:hypothetical protein
MLLTSFASFNHHHRRQLLLIGHCGFFHFVTSEIMNQLKYLAAFLGLAISS